MPATTQFSMAHNVCNEAPTGLPRPEKSVLLPPEAATPDAIGSGISSLPSGSLLLGLAEDGLPVLLDLYNPTPGPLMVAGDGGSGKTALLASLARLTGFADPGDIQFGVVTPYTEEWQPLEVLPHCLGIWPAYHPSAQTFLSQMVSWANVLPKTRQIVMLFFDGIDMLKWDDLQIWQDLRWLLMYGPEHHIWPVITANPACLSHWKYWLDYFHTVVIGQVKHGHNARYLVDDPKVNLADLSAGSQFELIQAGCRLKFWLPALEQKVEL